MSNPMISNDDSVSRLGVARFSSLARAYLKGPEAPELYDPVREQSCFDLVEEQVYDPVNAFLAHLDQRIDILDDFGLGKFFPGHGVGPTMLSAR
jgi:hypothetical protein